MKRYLKFLRLVMTIYATRDLLNDRSYTSKIGGARGVMVILIGNGRGDTSSNPGRG